MYYIFVKASYKSHDVKGGEVGLCVSLWGSWGCCHLTLSRETQHLSANSVPGSQLVMASTYLKANISGTQKQKQGVTKLQWAACGVASVSKGGYWRRNDIMHQIFFEINKIVSYNKMTWYKMHAIEVPYGILNFLTDPFKKGKRTR